MSTFQQMCHDRRNLLDESTLGDYSGAVISPVNYTQEDTAAQIQRLRMRSSGEFGFVLDPQLYFPKTEEGVLPKWRYFPDQFRSGDYTSVMYWKRIADNVMTVGRELHVQYIASPAVVPKVYDNAYFELLTEIGQHIANRADDRFEAMQSVIVSPRDLISEPSRPMRVASLVAATPCRWVYLMLDTDRKPRRELIEAGQLTGVMQFIHALESAGVRVLVAYSSSDVVLWKAAGATACATGKFFNVRRFSRSRFEEKEKGGGNLPYWFEESLLAFVREGDLARLTKERLVSKATVRNPAFASVVKAIEAGEPWVKLSWVAYMWWFADIEKRLSSGTPAKSLLGVARKSWRKLDELEIFMEEGPNTGDWIQVWLQADADFRKWRDAR
jgi:hypothetical protein